jgi:hypothetical protein
VIPDLRRRFQSIYSPERYSNLLNRLQERCGVPVGFRVAETPVFLHRAMLDHMAKCGLEMARELINDAGYMSEARASIPSGFCFAGETNRPHFLTADFALVRESDGNLAPRLVEIQAFPSVFGFQAALACAYREAYELGDDLDSYLGGLDSPGYWNALCLTVLGRQDPESVVLTEVDPDHQKTRPDFEVTARKLGVSIVDITKLESEGNRLFYRNRQGRQVPVRRIYNRAIADEIVSRGIRLPVDFRRPFDVEWAGHPNWYFLISKFSLPRLSRSRFRHVVPPAVFLDDFLNGQGRISLEDAGVRLPAVGSGATYDGLLLKPLFSFAGKGIQFAPSHEQLTAIPPDRRREYLLQQRMEFVPTIETPFGMTQAEVRILYVWPHSGLLTPVISLVRLGRGKMMGVDHNRDQQFVGASAAFFPK